MKVTILCLCIFITYAKASKWDNLTTNIAVVEFRRTKDASLTERQLIERNLLKYNEVLKAVPSDMHLDMIIFPELSLGISPETSTEIQVDDNPCQENTNYPQYISNLACLAKTYNTYLVTNIVEKVKCDPSVDASRNCRNHGTYFYNTNLVFDRTGKIVEKYRKYNLFGEKNLDQPPRPEIVSFETDFGVNFGTFTCFDILFKNPVQDLMKRSVDGVIYPTYWHSELPFLTALQTQQMWARVYDTMLFAAGGNELVASSGGTAIHRGVRGTLSSTYVLNEEVEILMYQSVNGEVTAPPESRDVDDLGSEMDAFPLMVDNSLKDYKYLTLNTSRNQIQEQICYQGEETDTILCCHFDIKLTNNPVTGDFYTYLLVAYAGIRIYPEVSEGALEVCAVIACLNSSISSCGRRFPKYENIQWPVTFEELKIEAVFDDSDDKVQFPNSLLSSIRPIDAGETRWTTIYAQGVIKRFEITKPQDRILTFGIYGRNFAHDAFFVDEDKDNGTNSVKIAFLTLICSLILTTM